MWHKGDRVTCKHKVPAYYSSYGDRPECYFEPDDVGIVASVGIPSTTRNRTFTRIVFDKFGLQWSAALLKDNIERI